MVVVGGWCWLVHFSGYADRRPTILLRTPQTMTKSSS